MLLVSSLQCSTRIFFEAVACQLNRELKQRRRGRQRERQKAIGLISRTTTLHVHHAFFVHFFAVVARLQRESA